VVVFFAELFFAMMYCSIWFSCCLMIQTVKSLYWKDAKNTIF